MTTAGVRGYLAQLKAAMIWLLWLIPLGAAVGSACALFLWSLDLATASRFSNPWLLYLLPVAGLLVGLFYHHWGKSAEGGNNLILEQIHEPGGGVPRRMAPLILVSTVITHWFGGSAGREGTAVQMGGSIAATIGRLFRQDARQMRILLMAGIAAGFGGVFGTPIAGAIFALEVLMVGRMQYEALIPCLLAAIIGDWTCQAWHGGHTRYTIAYMSGAGFHLDPWIVMKVALVGIAAGWVGALFAEMTHTLHGGFGKLISYPPFRPFVGGLLVIGLVHLTGTREYLGLGVWSPDPDDMTIGNFFKPGHIHPWAWALKILFTAVTLGSGFKGGEVTPLFFIGAALGGALSGVLHGPTDLFAAVGFVAIFAAASNTPLASTIMGVELFGATHGAYIATGCFLAYLCSGHSGIYLSQRVAVPKHGSIHIPPEVSLRHARQLQPTAIQRVLRDFHERFLPLPDFVSKPNPSASAMSHPHHIHSKETGMIRIYMKPGERRKTSGLKGFLTSRPLYRELVLAAKHDGIVNAVAHHNHYGYSNHAKAHSHAPESGNPELTMCVELISPRDVLESFCCRHGDLLKDKVIVYKTLEHWETRP